MTLAELSALSDDQLNVMLAELEGWVALEDKQTGLWTAENVNMGAIRGYHAGLSAEHCVAVSFPKFCSCLNETARVEAKLTLEQSTEYVNILWPMGYAPFQAVSASARQRTIALIAVKKGIK